jgi:hypothetical protein
MKQLYYTHAFPHLIGSAPIWGTEDDTKEYIQPLIRTQKKLLRIIKHLPPRTHTKPIMKELKILNLTNLYIQRVCTEIYPFIHPTKQINRPEHNHDYIWTAQIHEHQTRYSQQQHHYIPNPYNYSKIRKSNHTMEYHTSKYKSLERPTPSTKKQHIPPELQDEPETPPSRSTRTALMPLQRHPPPHREPPARLTTGTCLSTTDKL